MRSFQINLRSVEDVKKFSTAASMADFDIDVRSERYLVDGKSIMGLFSLNLSKPITVEVHGTPEEAAAFCEAISALVLKENPVLQQKNQEKPE